MAQHEPTFVKLHEHLYTRGHTRNYRDRGALLGAIQDREIRMIVNVSPRIDEILQGGCRMVGIEYLHEPLPDGKHIDEAKVGRLIEKVGEAIQHYSVLVHCNVGRNRSMLIAVPAIAIATMEPTSSVLNRIRILRPSCLANLVFEEYVLRFKYLEPMDPRM